MANIPIRTGRQEIFDFDIVPTMPSDKNLLAPCPDGYIGHFGRLSMKYAGLNSFALSGGLKNLQLHHEKVLF